MFSDWQSWTTLGIIVLTTVIFVWQAVVRRKKKGDGCGHGCACPGSSDLKKKDDD